MSDKIMANNAIEADAIAVVDPSLAPYADTIRRQASWDCIERLEKTLYGENDLSTKERLQAIINLLENFEPPSDDEDNEDEIDWADYYLLPRVIANVLVSRTDVLMICTYTYLALLMVHAAVVKQCKDSNRSNCAEFSKGYIPFVVMPITYCMILLAYYVYGSKIYWMDYGTIGYVRRQFRFVKNDKLWHKLTFFGMSTPILLIACCFAAYPEIIGETADVINIVFYYLYVGFIWYAMSNQFTEDVLRINEKADMVDFNMKWYEDSYAVFQDFECGVLSLILRDEPEMLNKFGINDWEVPVFLWAVAFDHNDDLWVEKIAQLVEKHIKDQVDRTRARSATRSKEVERISEHIEQLQLHHIGAQV